MDIIWCDGTTFNLSDTTVRIGLESVTEAFLRSSQINLLLLFRWCLMPWRPGAFWVFENYTGALILSLCSEKSLGLFTTYNKRLTTKISTYFSFNMIVFPPQYATAVRIYTDEVFNDTFLERREKIDMPPRSSRHHTPTDFFHMGIS